MSDDGSETREAAKLGPVSVLGMAVGGMVGGGIFSTLGVTISLAGHLAFAAFLLGGAVALVTAHAYARLTIELGAGGGAFGFLRQLGRPGVAGWLAWLLVLGYVFTMSVYAFTFGHYLANVLGLGTLVARVAGIAVIAVFVVVNLRSVGTSGTVENVIVAGKLLILLLVATIGIGHFAPSRLTPLPDQGWLGVFLGASVIFMAYEGFQLLTYDYDDIREPDKTLAWALPASVAAVIAVYVVVTLGSQMLVSDRLIVERKEVAFAVAGREALGAFGFWFASVGAVLSTGSAINATLFATARLVRDVARVGDMPERFAREKGGLPQVAILSLGFLAAVFSLLPQIEQIVSFGSLTFLLAFGLVNALYFRQARGAGRAVAATGATACFAATVGLLYYLATEEPIALAIVVACGVLLIAARLTFLRVTGSRARASA